MGCDWAQGFLFSPAVPAGDASIQVRMWGTADVRTIDAA
jgi:hypothetical protein